MIHKINPSLDYNLKRLYPQNSVCKPKVVPPTKTRDKGHAIKGLDVWRVFNHIIMQNIKIDLDPRCTKIRSRGVFRPHRLSEASQSLDY